MWSECTQRRGAQQRPLHSQSRSRMPCVSTRGAYRRSSTCSGDAKEPGAPCLRLHLVAAPGIAAQYRKSSFRGLVRTSSLLYMKFFLSPPQYVTQIHNTLDIPQYTLVIHLPTTSAASEPSNNDKVKVFCRSNEPMCEGACGTVAKYHLRIRANKGCYQGSTASTMQLPL